MSLYAVCMLVYLPRPLGFNHLTDFHETWYECYEIAGSPCFVLYTFPLLITDMADVRADGLVPKLSPIN